MDLTSHLEQLRTDGYTIVERLIDSDSVSLLLAQVRTLENPQTPSLLPGDV
jgi:hypothetical protein